MRGRLPMRFPLPGCGRYSEACRVCVPCRMSPFDEKTSFVTGTELRREVD